MDIDKEKQKALYLHKLDVRKLVYDKLLIGLLIAVIAFIGSMLVESYKAGFVKERFWLEKRLSAISEIMDKYAKMDYVYQDISTPRPSQPNADNIEGRYIVTINALLKSGNENKHLLSEDFTNELQNHIIIHSLIQQCDVKTIYKYSDFISGLSSDFVYLCEEELDVPIRNNVKRFPFLENNWVKVLTMGKKYLDSEFERWNNLERDKGRHIKNNEMYIIAPNK